MFQIKVVDLNEFYNLGHVMYEEPRL